MPPQPSVNDPPPNPSDAANPTASSAKPQARSLRRHDSLVFLQPDLTTYQATDVKRTSTAQNNTTQTPNATFEGVARCRDLWFEDGDVIIWAHGRDDSMLYRVHRRVLKDSGAEPFCTIVDWDYPNPETSDELFLDGVWVLKYADQDPLDVMYVLKWMYEQP